MCLESFIDWPPTNSVLYDHNAKRFDARFVMREMESLQLTPDFQERMLGVCGSVATSKEVVS